ncbi:MAG: hypothetical protein Q7S48_03570 [bacterium]|nr:hypothetical protein [bacterium]
MERDKYLEKQKELEDKLGAIIEERKPLDKICLSKRVISGIDPQSTPVEVHDRWESLREQEQTIYQQIENLRKEYFNQ